MEADNKVHPIPEVERTSEVENVKDPIQGSNGKAEGENIFESPSVAKAVEGISSSMEVHVSVDTPNKSGEEMSGISFHFGEKTEDQKVEISSNENISSDGYTQNVKESATSSDKDEGCMTQEKPNGHLTKTISSQIVHMLDYEESTTEHLLEDTTEKEKVCHEDDSTKHVPDTDKGRDSCETIIEGKEEKETMSSILERTEGTNAEAIKSPGHTKDEKALKDEKDYDDDRSIFISPQTECQTGEDEKKVTGDGEGARNLLVNPFVNVVEETRLDDAESDTSRKHGDNSIENGNQEAHQFNEIIINTTSKDIDDIQSSDILVSSFTEEREDIAPKEDTNSAPLRDVIRTVSENDTNTSRHEEENQTKMFENAAIIDRRASKANESEKNHVQIVDDSQVACEENVQRKTDQLDMPEGSKRESRDDEASEIAAEGQEIAEIPKDNKSNDILLENEVEKNLTELLHVTGDEIGNSSFGELIETTSDHKLDTATSSEDIHGGLKGKCNMDDNKEENMPVVDSNDKTNNEISCNTNHDAVDYPAVEEKLEEPAVEEKHEEPTVEEKPREPAVTEKHEEPAIEEKPAVEEKLEEPEVEEKHEKLAAEEKPRELIVEEKAEEPTPEELEFEEKPEEPSVEEIPEQLVVEEKSEKPAVKEEKSEKVTLLEKNMSVVDFNEKTDSEIQCNTNNDVADYLSVEANLEEPELKKNLKNQRLRRNLKNHQLRRNVKHQHLRRNLKNQ
uniref:Titin-like isoform X2 n=1 Tax=Nicotiana sylvestris TaxID=4096 RepID=A0A1U7XQT6_NICSY|nr:PREDICTED: titin-like isoform X2 [Nicotiana sylvestris]